MEPTFKQPEKSAENVAQPLDEISKKDVFENKDLAALSYFWCLSIFLFFYKRKSAFVRFHAKQGIVLFLISIVGFLLPGILTKLVQIAVLFLSAWGFLNAAQGTWKEVAFAGAFARGKFSPRDSWKLCVNAIVKAWITMKSIWTKQSVVTDHALKEQIIQSDLDTMSNIDVPGEGDKTE